MRDHVTIDGRRVGDGAPAFIVAEVGVNHNGDTDTALAMVDAIADAGADCVKFQTFSAEEFVSNPDDTYEYISQGKVVKESMLEMFRRLELKREEFRRLFDHARRRGLIAMSTPTDRDAVDLLEEIGVGAYKVGSDDLVYSPFLDYVASKGKPVIISAGMATAKDVERAVSTIRATGNDQVIVLHCVSEYPTPPGNVNLRKIGALRELVQGPVGFSDHSQGIVAAMGAVALGACFIEKHFTLDRNMPGPDHRFSADPDELTRLVAGIRELEMTLGHDDLVPTEAEIEMAKLARRSIVAAADLPEGHVLGEKDLAFQRPGTGLYPYHMDIVLGRRLGKSHTKGQQILLANLED